MKYENSDYITSRENMDIENIEFLCRNIRNFYAKARRKYNVEKVAEFILIRVTKLNNAFVTSF